LFVFVRSGALYVVVYVVMYCVLLFNGVIGVPIVTGVPKDKNV